MTLRSRLLLCALALAGAVSWIQTIAPHTVCGLNLAGTSNTAMTAEFNAGVTGEVQSVSISGYNVF